MLISNVFNNFNFTPFKTPLYRAFRPLPYDTVSFSGKKPSLKTQIEQMPKEALPSDEYREYLINELLKPDNQKDLTDIHNEYYKGLMDCTTLDEAKEKYPEFNNVIDAKDADLSLLGHRHILVQISKGELSKRAPDLSLDNISLELLKKYYAQTISVRDKDNYWGFAKSAISSLLSLLKIKMSSEYSKMIISSKIAKGTKQQWLDPEYRTKILNILNDPENTKKRSEAASTAGKARWQDPEYRAKMSNHLKERWQNPEYRAKMSNYLKEHWQDPIYRENILSYLTSEEYIEKAKAGVSKAGKERWQDEEYRLLMAVVNKAAEISWEVHPECSEIYKEAAKDFPRLAKIISKEKNGGQLSDFERGYLSAYFKTCHDIMLQTDGGEKTISQIIGETQKNILSELGFYEEGRNIQKIAKLIGVEQKGESIIK